jgi:hypothetical protein
LAPGIDGAPARAEHEVHNVQYNVIYN